MSFSHRICFGQQITFSLYMMINMSHIFTDRCEVSLFVCLLHCNVSSTELRTANVNFKNEPNAISVCNETVAKSGEFSLPQGRRCHAPSPPDTNSGSARISWSSRRTSQTSTQQKQHAQMWRKAWFPKSLWAAEQNMYIQAKLKTFRFTDSIGRQMSKIVWRITFI